LSPELLDYYQNLFNTLFPLDPNDPNSQQPVVDPEFPPGDYPAPADPGLT